MSEVEVADNVPETGPITVDDVLQAIQQKNIGRAKAAFQDVMSQKVNDALESEKVKVASQVFNPHVETEEPEAELEDTEESEAEVEENEEESSLDTEVEAAFEEEEEEEEVS